MRIAGPIRRPASSGRLEVPAPLAITARVSLVTQWNAWPEFAGRTMVLVGDAADATSPSAGQGASMAMEDAAVLAKCLRDFSDQQQAFVAYERLRRERVERVVRYSARVGKSKVAGPVGRVFRDLMMPFALKLFANPNARAWLDQYHVDW